MKYNSVEIKDGNSTESVQYVGVYTLNWKREWGAPEIGFVEAEVGEFGKLRSDSDGHNYIIPESKVEDFELFMEGFESCGSQGESEDIYYALLSRFEKDWGQYQIDGKQRDFRIVLPIQA